MDIIIGTLMVGAMGITMTLLAISIVREIIKGTPYLLETLGEAILATTAAIFFMCLEVALVIQLFRG